MQTTTRRFLCSAGLIFGATAMLACLSFATAQQPVERGNRNDAANAYEAARQKPSDFNARFSARGGLGDVVRQIDDSYDQQTRNLLSKYGTANDQAERDQLVKGLTDIAAQEFDARQESRNQELKNLEDQLKKLRAVHERRAKEKDDIVRDRVRHLLRDADGRGWGADRVGSPASLKDGKDYPRNNSPRAE